MAKSSAFSAPAGELVPFPQSGDVLRAVMENAPIGMSLVSAEGRVIYANQAFADMFRRPRQECLGLTARELVAPGMAERASEQIRGLATGETDSYRVERLYLRNDGSTFWGLASASAVRRDGAGAPIFIIIQVIDIDLQKRAAATIAEAESRWNFALESAGQGVWDHDLRTGQSFYSRMWRVMRGMDPDAPVEDTQEIWLGRVHPEDRAYAREQERRFVKGEVDYQEYEYRERHRDGHWIWILSRGRPVEWSPDGSVARVIGTDTDVTRIKATETRLALALTTMADGLVLYDQDERLVFCNDQFKRMFPKTPGVRVPGARLVDIVQASIDAGEPAGITAENGDAYIENVRSGLKAGGEWDFEMSDGRWLHARAKVIPEDGGYLNVVSDITERKHAELALSALNRRLEELARMDGLTGITNRRAFDEALEAEFRRSVRSATPLSLLLIDVDHFKAFNDTYGHPEGDDCLKAVAKVLTGVLNRPGDLAARYGGEEFAAILPETDARGAMAIAESIRMAVSRLGIGHAGSPARLVTASIGVSAFTGDGSPGSVAELVQDADDALYAAKAAGRDRVLLGRGEGKAAGGYPPADHRGDEN
jgi:diguanylate cyclase (GGDEF)-like protein/PAS domain S-box-containing protein